MVKQKLTQGPPKRPGGQGTGHLSKGAVNAFSQAPNSKPVHKGGAGGGGSRKTR
jgi:hypothetical protein